MRPEVPGNTSPGPGPEGAAPWPVSGPRELPGSAGAHGLGGAYRPLDPAGLRGPLGPGPQGSRSPDGSRGSWQAAGAERAVGPLSGRARWRPAALLVALVVGIAGLGVAGTGLAVQLLPRSFSVAQRQRITTWEIGKRWRTWPAGDIFPAAIPYRLPGLVLGGSPGTGLELTSHRIGIAPQAPCAAATDPALARVLAGHGCLATLRATYDDATQALAVTVGVAVLPSGAAARASARGLPGSQALRPGVRAVAFPHTVVAAFADGQRQVFWEQPVGPYLIMAAAGYADGRPGARLSTDNYTHGEMLSLAKGVGHWVASHLGADPPSPHCPGSPAC